MYAEEAEWCARLKKVGKLCIYGQYRVLHLQGATANKSFKSTGQGYYNLYNKKRIADYSFKYGKSEKTVWDFLVLIPIVRFYVYCPCVFPLQLF